MVYGLLPPESKKQYISGMNIGMIGLGDMGRLYAKAFAAAGYTVCGCDLPENRQQLEAELDPLGIKLMDNGKDVARMSDLIIYSVEADRLEQVAAEYGPATKYGAIVAGDPVGHRCPIEVPISVLDETIGRCAVGAPSLGAKVVYCR